MSDVQQRLMVSQRMVSAEFPNVGVLLLAAEPNEKGFELHQVANMSRQMIITVLEAALSDIRAGLGNFAEEETIQ
jgi:uncharacterized membrane protein